VEKLRVLIVEDQVDDAVLAVRTLRQAGFDVEHRQVQTADAMSAALQEDSWDVVLSDYSMPSFDAPRALQLLKSSGKDLPFIIVSGSIGEETAVETLKAGATDFVMKGNIERLGPAVERSLEEARLRSQRDHAIQALREAVRARDQFLSIASHELKTPLTSLQLQIQVLLKLLRGQDLAARAEETLKQGEVIERSGRRLARLINELLDISRATSGMLPIDPTPTDLVPVVHTAVKHLADMAAQTGTSVRVHAPAKLEGTWDAERLDTALTNLLTNAMKYGRREPIDVVLEEQGNNAVVRVTDRGIGIDTRDQERIFERFERAVPDRHYGGFGVGLWLTREVVQAHRGTISVESEPGRGATFTMILPRRRR
jgi:signal transduction histidine kinase